MSVTWGLSLSKSTCSTKGHLYIYFTFTCPCQSVCFRKMLRQALQLLFHHSRFVMLQIVVQEMYEVTITVILHLAFPALISNCCRCCKWNIYIGDTRICRHIPICLNTSAYLSQKWRNKKIILQTTKKKYRHSTRHLQSYVFFLFVFAHYFKTWS